MPYIPSEVVAQAREMDLLTYAKDDQDGRPQRQDHQADGKIHGQSGGQDHAENH